MGRNYGVKSGRWIQKQSRKPHVNYTLYTYHVFEAWSVCQSVCRLSQSCPVLKPSDGFRCH